MVVLSAEDTPPLALASVLRETAASVNANVPLFDLRTLDDLYQSRALLPSRMMSRIVTALGVLGLVLACVGLYSVIAFLFANRTHEIGIRMAVGASPSRVLGMVLTHASFLGPAGPGCGAGTCSAAHAVPRQPGIRLRDAERPARHDRGTLVDDARLYRRRDAPGAARSSGEPDDRFEARLIEP